MDESFNETWVSAGTLFALAISCILFNTVDIFLLMFKVSLPACQKGALEKGRQ